MAGLPSRLRVIGSMLAKDLKLYSRDVIFIFLTVLAVVTFVTLYYVLPRKVDETIAVGVHGPGVRQALTALASQTEQGVSLAWYDDSTSLRQAVEKRKVEVGVDFPNGFPGTLSSGKQTQVTVYVRPTLSPEISNSMKSMVQEIAYTVAGYPSPVSLGSNDIVVLGPDKAGDQTPIRDKMKPLYAFMILIMEAVALGALIASEVQQRTITALLSTPARIGDILAAKMLMGTGIAASETLIVLLIIRGFGAAPGLVVLAVLLGAVLVTSIAMLAGSAGKDLMATMILGIVILIPLAVPAFAVLFPGEPAGWIRVIPSYGLVQVLLAARDAATAWSSSAKYLLILAGWSVVLGAAGTLVLKRRAQTL